MEGGNMSFIIMLVLLALVIWGIVGLIKALINNASNTPTWKGIIISAIFGLLPFYLIMCFFGWAGESRKQKYNEDDDPFADRWHNDR